MRTIRQGMPSPVVMRTPQGALHIVGLVVDTTKRTRRAGDGMVDGERCHRGHSFHCFSRLYFIFLTRSLLFKSNFHTITHLSQKRMNKEHHWYWGGRLGVLDLWGQSKGV